MIRRNHIETVARIDRKSLQSQGRTSYQNRYAYKKEPEIEVDENYRAVSSNRKYYQYKDWKQQASNKPSVDKAQQTKREVGSLHQFNTNQVNLRKRVQKDNSSGLDQVFMRQNLNTRVDSKKYRSKQQRQTSVYSYLKDNKQKRISYELNMDKPIRQQPVYSHQASFDKQIHQSPPRERKENKQAKNYTSLNYQYSSHKNSEKRQFPHRQRPYKGHHQCLDQQNECLKNYEDSDYSKRQGYKLTNYRQTLKTLQQQKKQNLNNSNIRSSRRVSFQPSFREFSGNNLLPVGEGRSIDQKVGDKLKMISDFNDQINDRIKNIIVCFEELRTRM